MTTTLMLTCPECQRENESERIYCRNCGTRLDRSNLTGRKAVLEKPQQVHRRLRRLFNPQRGRFQRFFSVFYKVVLGACLTAVLVEIALPVDIGPPSKTIGLSRQINFDLENATIYHRPPELRYTQDEVNTYLAYDLKGKRRSLDKPLVQFGRVVVQFSEGTCAVTVERSIFGHPVYQRALYGVTTAKGKMAFTPKGEWIGQLPIAPRIMPYAGIIFADIWSALKRERTLIAKMSGVEFHDGCVVFTTPAP
jgi:hypothetical protein